MRNDLYFQNFDARAPRNGCTESIVRFTINFRSFFQSCAYFVKPCSRSLGRIGRRAFEFRSPVPRTFDSDTGYWNLEMIKFRRYPKPYFPNPAEAEGQKIKESASHHVKEPKFIIELISDNCRWYESTLFDHLENHHFHNFCHPCWQIFAGAMKL